MTYIQEERILANSLDWFDEQTGQLAFDID